jgi:hypothetical protein
MQRETLIGMAALHCTLAKMDGHVIDKKCMRFNAMADYMELCSAGFSDNKPLVGLSEAVSTCIIGHDMYTGVPFDVASYGWMK